MNNEINRKIQSQLITSEQSAIQRSTNEEGATNVAPSASIGFSFITYYFLTASVVLWMSLTPPDFMMSSALSTSSGLSV